MKALSGTGLLAGVLAALLPEPPPELPLVDVEPERVVPLVEVELLEEVPVELLRLESTVLFEAAVAELDSAEVALTLAVGEVVVATLVLLNVVVGLDPDDTPLVAEGDSKELDVLEPPAPAPEDDPAVLATGAEATPAVEP